MGQKTKFFLFIALFIFGFSLPVFSNNSPVIAVSDFSNQTGQSDLNYLEKGLTSTLITRLANYQGLNIVERSRFQSIIQELGFNNSGFIDENRAAQVGLVAGAKQIIVGELVKAGSQYRLNVRVIETETAKVLLAIQEEVNSINNTFYLVDVIADKIAKNLILKDFGKTKNPTTKKTDNFDYRVEKNISSDNFFWLGAGAGLYVSNFNIPLRTSFNFSYEFSNNLISLNLLDLTGFLYSSYGTSEVGLLYGRTFRNDSFITTISGGLGFALTNIVYDQGFPLNSVGSTSRNFGLSLPLELGIIFPVTNNFGIGAKVKGNFLGPFQYLGIGLEVPFGKIK